MYALVIDDDIDARAITMLALQEKGFHCVGAANGLEAMNYMFDPRRPGPPFLILLDLNMPVMTGHQFLNVIRSCTPMSKIPLVVISANRETPDGYPALLKPFAIEALWDFAQKAKNGSMI